VSSLNLAESPGALPRFRRRQAGSLERCLACEADFEGVACDTWAMADKCEADFEGVACDTSAMADKCEAGLGL
jgi:hypothetical protein